MPDNNRTSFREFVAQLNESADWEHVSSAGPFHPSRGGKKLGDLHKEVSSGPHKHKVRISGNPAWVSLHVHKKFKNDPDVKKIVDKFHKIK